MTKLLLHSMWHSSDFFLLHWKSLCEGGPWREILFLDGTSDKTFQVLSRSFKVASNRLMSMSLSPELWSDSRRILRLRFETLLRFLQVIWLKTSELGSASVRLKPFRMSSSRLKSWCPASLSTPWEDKVFYFLALLLFGGSFSCCAKSADKATHRLTSFVRFLMSCPVLQVLCVHFNFFGEDGSVLCWVAETNSSSHKLFRRKIEPLL